jgi:hypothetical protein
MKHGWTLCILAVLLAFSSYAAGQTDQCANGIAPGFPPSPSTSLTTLYHCPVEQDQWQTMINDTAYFRDLWVGIGGTLVAVQPSETWYLQAIPPASGLPRNWGQITYQKTTADGRNDCWTFGLTTYCDYGTSSNVFWWMNAQCITDGKWTFKLTDSASSVAPTKTFTLSPKIDIQYVPSDNQGFYGNWTNVLDRYDSICIVTDMAPPYTKHYNQPCDSTHLAINEQPYTIQNAGCYLTSARNILTYHMKQNVSVLDLNAWLRDPVNFPKGMTGFTSSGKVDPHAIARYAHAHGVPNFSYVNAYQGSASLRQSVCAYGPQIIQSNEIHWPTAYGFNDAKDVLLSDPGDGSYDTFTTSYHYAGAPLSSAQTRIFSGPDTALAPKPGMFIALGSPAELLITDPTGKRLGFDPTTKIGYSEIPNSVYSREANGDDSTGVPDPDPVKVLDLMSIIQGDYTLQLTGTGTGTYNLDIRAYDQNDNPSPTSFLKMPIYNGQIITYKIPFDPTGTTPLVVNGGFDGGGQRPKDVNKFLTYASPNGGKTVLTGGVTSYALVIFYAPSVISSSFTATLNGGDVSQLFHPLPGTHEVVNLNLNAGSNVLVLSIDGNLPTRVATDTDRLTFSVQ